MRKALVYYLLLGVVLVLFALPTVGYVLSLVYTEFHPLLAFLVWGVTQFIWFVIMAVYFLKNLRW